MSNIESAWRNGLVLCNDCHLTVRQNVRHPDQPQYCPRCGSHLQPRRPNSIARTWALIITAWVCVIPANLYPVMTVVYLGEGTPDTILSGIIRLAQKGMLPIAVIVFVASILVPVLKLLGLMFLLLMVQRGWKLNKRQCTMLYRVIEVIGAWSMLDLFMISILVTLVDMGSVAKVAAGTGATAFATVVVLTMFAAMSFDPRLIWDLQEKKHD